MATFTQPLPWAEAITDREARTLLPTTLSAAEYRLLGSDLIRRSVISAKVTNAGFLQLLNDLIIQIAGGPTEEDESARDRGQRPLLIDLPQAREKLRAFLDSIDYQPERPGTIQDLRSERRLNLTVNTNVETAANYGSFVAGQDADVLEVFPAQELFRLIDANEPRNWLNRWARAGGKTFGGRMIALKDDPVWANLGSVRLFEDSLGNPFPPFAFNSGMDVRDISRDEAERLGVMPEGGAAPQPQTDKRLNDDLGIETSRFGSEMLSVLARDPDLQVSDGVLTIRE